MNLTPQQQAAIKADIASKPALASQPATADGALAIRDWYNANAQPDYWVWRTSVNKDEYLNSTSVDGTTFDWTGVGFITRAVGERDAWREMFVTGAVDPSRANVRKAFADIFSGVGAAAANRTHLLTISRRLASRIEQMFAVGAGTIAAPSTMAFEGPVTYQDIEAARNS